MIYERTTPSDIFLLPLEVAECDIIIKYIQVKNYLIRLVKNIN